MSGSCSFFVSKIEVDKLTVDGNHPFAGKTLTYAVTVADIRDASEEEKQKGISKPVMHWKPISAQPLFYSMIVPLP